MCAYKVSVTPKLKMAWVGWALPSSWWSRHQSLSVVRPRGTAPQVILPAFLTGKAFYYFHYNIFNTFIKYRRTTRISCPSHVPYVPAPNPSPSFAIRDFKKVSPSFRRQSCFPRRNIHMKYIRKKIWLPESLESSKNISITYLVKKGKGLVWRKQVN